MATARLSFVWDYDLDEEGFRALLEGRRTATRLDRNWAAVRLLEYASYPDIRRLLSLRDLVAGWPSWRGRIRSQTRRRGLDFLADWLAPSGRTCCWRGGPLAQLREALPAAGRGPPGSVRH